MLLKKKLKQYLTEHPQDVVIPFLTKCNILLTFCSQCQSYTATQNIRNSPWDKESGFTLILRDWAIQRRGSVILQNDEQAEYFKTPKFKSVKKNYIANMKQIRFFAHNYTKKNIQIL